MDWFIKTFPLLVNFDDDIVNANQAFAEILLYTQECGKV